MIPDNLLTDTGVARLDALRNEPGLTRLLLASIPYSQTIDNKVARWPGLHDLLVHSSLTELDLSGMTKLIPGNQLELATVQSLGEALGSSRLIRVYLNRCMAGPAIVDKLVLRPAPLQQLGLSGDSSPNAQKLS